MTVKELKCEGPRAQTWSESGRGRGNGEKIPVLLPESIRTDHYTFYCLLTFISSADTHNLLQNIE